MSVVIYKKVTWMKIGLGTGIFVLTFAIYYRLLEVVFSLPFGYRVPEILIFGKNIIWQQTPFLSIGIWSLVHGLAFFIPALALYTIQTKLKFKY